MYLLDTNVVSELRKVNTGRAHPHVKVWSDNQSLESTFLSVITIMELEQGTLLMERRDPGQGTILRAWLDGQIQREFDGRVLPVDMQIAKRCAALHVPDPYSYRDSLIAATALVHGMIVVTRNVSHFARTGVKTFNPWEA